MPGCGISEERLILSGQEVREAVYTKQLTVAKNGKN